MVAARGWGSEVGLVKWVKGVKRYKLQVVISPGDVMDRWVGVVNNAELNAF